MKKYNAFQLKLFFALLMVLDHLDKIPGLLPPWWSEIFHVITRCVAPFFGYMAIEGFIYTTNKFNYNKRLFVWAGIMFIGNIILNYLFKSKSLIIENNIFFTLAMGVLALNIWCYKVKNKKINSKLILTLRIFIAVPITIYSFIAYEGSNSVVPFMFICYFLRDNKKIRNWAILALSVILIIPTIQIMPSWQVTLKLFMFNSDWLLITVIPFLSLYNGERGPKNNFTKYFFYIFYPAHLWLITTIAYYIK